MTRQWLAGAWAFLGVPAAIVLVGYSEKALYVSLWNSPVFLIVGGVLPGACIGLGVFALLSVVKSGWPQRALAAAVYGTVVYILAETVGNPVLATHAALVAMPK
jgi:hypothetical protein